MKKKVVFLIIMLIIAATMRNLFPSTSKIDSEIHKDRYKEFEYFGKEYNIGSFHKDLLELKPGLSSDEVKLYTQDYIDA
ncbi:hypothetical protein [Anaerococcus lactolyticus]|uniref:Uncharacterized protein n=1 Tax=Anaerococcus lactolyticus S7-1-13 TaxID=1284686 RepID=A0A095Z8E1_9FIRM|nr:hypothetical protein [Anaerococcus lactolyticus]KGF04734.1 hypothetical protein HMPREF1630_02720 [Anaerococcus lactolyticus S7-1-13]